MFKMDNEWIDGKVFKVCQRWEDEDSAINIPYAVWPHHRFDPNNIRWYHVIFEDTDDSIRVRKGSGTAYWNPSTFSKLFIKSLDPLYYLYSDRELYENYSKADAIILKWKRNNDGLEFGRRLSTVENSFGFIQDTHTLPKEFLGNFGCYIANWRPVTSALTVKSDLPIMLDLCCLTIPNTTCLKELEAQSKTSNEKMLLLGDALSTGVHGWQMDRERAL